MSEYKDMFGSPFIEGDIVLQPIYINHDTWMHRCTVSQPFMIYQVRMDKDVVIFDSAYTWGSLINLTKQMHEFVNISRMPKDKTLREVWCIMSQITRQKELDFELEIDRKLRKQIDTSVEHKIVKLDNFTPWYKCCNCSFEVKRQTECCEQCGYMMTDRPGDGWIQFRKEVKKNG